MTAPRMSRPTANSCAQTSSFGCDASSSMIGTRAERSLSAVSDLTGIDPDKIKYTIKRTLGKLRKQPEVRDLLAYLETDDLE